MRTFDFFGFAERTAAGAAAGWMDVFKMVHLPMVCGDIVIFGIIVSRAVFYMIHYSRLIFKETPSGGTSCIDNTCRRYSKEMKEVRLQCSLGLVPVKPNISK